MKSDYLFCDKHGGLFKDIKSYFHAACKKVRIQDFPFHDCCLCLVSHVPMKGISLIGLPEILGHKTMTMTLRYAHLSREHKKKAVNLLNGLTASGKGNCHRTVTSANVSETATT